MITLSEAARPVVMVAIFVVTYSCLAVFKIRRTRMLWGGLVLAWLFGLIPLADAFGYDVHWNVIGVFAGTLVLADIFGQSGVPEYLARAITSRSRTMGMATVSVCALSGFLSIFLENVAVVLILAPIALALAREQKRNPIPFLIGIAISSNLQGAATLIGDPPSMILAGKLHLDFNDFFFRGGRPSIFFGIQIGAVASLAVLYLFFRGQSGRPQTEGALPAHRWGPTWMLALLIAALAVSPVWDPGFKWLAGTLTMVLAVAGAIVFWRRGGELSLRRFDFRTLFFLLGIFIMVGGLERTGVVARLGDMLAEISGGSVGHAYMLLVWVSVLFSAFVDNVPYVTVMITVAADLAGRLSVAPELFAFGLLIGACVGGNITPVGAAANIVAVGMLQREGNPVSFPGFMKIGIPFTLVATACGALFIWLAWRGAPG